MSHKKIVGVILVVAICALGFSYVFSGPSVCVTSLWACTDISLQLRSISFVVSIPIALLSIILLFVRRETFIAWARFAVPAFLIMLAIIFYTYNNEPAMGGWVNWGSDDQLATLLLPSLFFLTSLIIIIRSSLKLRKI